MRDARSLGEAFRLIFSPPIRRFVIGPLVVNVVLFALMMGVVIDLTGRVAEALVAWLPEWLAALEYLVWLLGVAVGVLFIAYAFAAVATFIASPFYGRLAERVLAVARPERVAFEQPPFLTATLGALKREMAKIGYQLPRAVALLLLSFVPVLNLIAPALLFVFGAWFMALQYLDYAADVEGVDFRDLREAAATRRLDSTLFGAAVLVLLMIPVVNLVAMPAAVVAATLFWADRLAPSGPSDRDLGR